jgi:hypothetical protein
LNNVFRTVLALCVSGILYGCQSQSISPDKLRSAQSVSVSPNVKVASTASYLGRAQLWGGVLGSAVGAIAGQAANKDVPDQIKLYLTQQNIDPGQIVRAEFQKGLRADPRFANRVVDVGSAHFELNVFIYGLTESGPFSSGYKPWLSVQATLIDASGKTVWQGKNWVGAHSDIAEVPFDQYFADPATFRNALTIAADEVTRSLLKDMGN